MASKIGIVKAAASQGFGVVIESLDDNSSVSRLVDAHYEILVETALTQHGWTFASKSEDLTLLADDPVPPWSGVWAAPTDMLALRWVQMGGDSAVRLDWQETWTASTKAISILQDVSEATAYFTFRAPESRWPADLAIAMQLRMEAVFLRSLEQFSEADNREARAAFLERRAMRRDKTSSTLPDPDEWDLTAARARSRARIEYR